VHPAKDKLPLPSPRPFAAAPPDPPDLAGPPWSFDGVLRRVIGFSRAATLVPRAAGPRGAANVRVPDRRDRRSSAAFDALRLFVRTLDEPTLQKLDTLMRAGRDGVTLGVAHSLRDKGATAVPLGPSAELFDDGAASLEYVQRGHAIACATQFDLEAGVEAWADGASAGTLDERVWLRFARELAASSVNEWSCLALIGREDRLETLYLSRRNGAWWSFGSVIDRPSAAHVASLQGKKQGEARAVSLPLLAVVGRPYRKSRPAVRRAILAISARLGCCRLTPSGLSGGA
jgi:hypothetical protein